MAACLCLRSPATRSHRAEMIKYRLSLLGPGLLLANVVEGRARDKTLSHLASFFNSNKGLHNHTHAHILLFTAHTAIATLPPVLSPLVFWQLAGAVDNHWRRKNKSKRPEANCCLLFAMLATARLKPLPVTKGWRMGRKMINRIGHFRSRQMHVCLSRH